MATTYKVLGQSNPTLNTLTDIYTVPAATSAVCSTLVVCNQSASQGTYRIAIRKAGAAISAPQYLVYDAALPANSTDTLTIGMTLATTDIVSVYASSSSMSFNLFGSELT